MTWLATLLRIAVGGVFLAAGALKLLDIGHPEHFAAQIAGFRILPDPLVAPLAILLPFVEVLVGGYLVAGLFTRAAAWAAVALAAAFDLAIASAVVRGLTVSCGCFGAGDTTTTSWAEVGRDAVLVGAAVAVALLGPGRFALDARWGERGAAPAARRNPA